MKKILDPFDTFISAHYENRDSLSGNGEFFIRRTAKAKQINDAGVFSEKNQALL